MRRNQVRLIVWLLAADLLVVSCGGDVKADGSGHFVHLDRSELVVDAITSVLADASRP